MILFPALPRFVLSTGDYCTQRKGQVGTVRARVRFRFSLYIIFIKRSN